MNLFRQIESNKSLLPGLDLTVFNVGQGDHSLLRLPNGKFGIIDFFCKGQHEPQALSVLREELRLAKDQGEKLSIAFVCITHMDKDHIGGLGHFSRWVLENLEYIELERIWLPATDKSKFTIFLDNFIHEHEKNLPVNQQKVLYHSIKEYKKNLHDFNKLLLEWKTKSKDNNEKYLSIGTVTEALDNLVINCVAPASHHAFDFDTNMMDQFWRNLFRNVLSIGNNDAGVMDDPAFFKNVEGRADRNMISSALVVKIKDNGKRILFGGDVPTETWESCINIIERDHGSLRDELTCDLIKASHHGSRHSSSESLWARMMKPDCDSNIVFSAGTQYKHPHDETLQHINKVAKDRKLHPFIFTTNMCTRCLESIRSEEKVIMTTKKVDSNSGAVRLYDSIEQVNLHSSGKIPLTTTHLKLIGFFFHYPIDAKDKVQSYYLVGEGKDLPSYSVHCQHGEVLSGFCQSPEKPPTVKDDGKEDPNNMTKPEEKIVQMDSIVTDGITNQSVDHE